jgi:hypothetical protein
MFLAARLPVISPELLRLSHPAGHWLLPVLCSLFSVLCSLLPVACSLLPKAFPLLPATLQLTDSG